MTTPDFLDRAPLCPLTIGRALDRAAALAPDVEAVVSGTDRVTYRELHTRVAHTRAILSSRGVGRGDHVALCMQNCAQWVELFVAITALGAVAVPINTRFTAGEIEYALRQSRSRILITVDTFLRNDYIAMLEHIDAAIGRSTGGRPMPSLEHLDEVIVVGERVPAGALDWSALTPDSGTAVGDVADPTDPALIQYTSGTTSFPKGALLTHRSLCANAYFSGVRQGLRVGDRFHSVRPFFHVAGTTLSIISCIQHAATLVTMERFEAGPALELMEREHCTHFSGNDTIALMLLDHPERRARALSLRGAWIAASAPIVERVIRELGAAECVTGYGMSETSPNVAMSAWWEPEDIRISTAMTIQPGVELRIADLDTGAALPAGTTGEIQVSGWPLMLGYFDMPDNTAAAFTDDGWLRTGDLGHLDATGRLLFTGRAKEMLRVGGENVAPADIEDTLARHPLVDRAVVVGVHDPRLQEVPFAFIQLSAGRACSSGDVIEWCRTRMAGFKVPRHIEFIDDVTSLGMTASSKVKKSDAAARAADILANRSDATS